ncbi:hypothetical protein MLD38_029376 [Melastoma candidum]|uniref:Uncharacterized protein n=1 Tax=Melastoma candidum TaxID=119954 RepID=A0ACB9N617_9MYRT|nr:hypothetical protein MLD38_029376 [Melastoma candidum]
MESLASMGWNDKWVGYDEQFWFIALFAVSLICYLAAFVFSGVSGSLLPASVISFYCMYLCYSGLAREPSDYGCNAGSSTTFISPPSSPHGGEGKPLLPLDKVEEHEEKERLVHVVLGRSNLVPGQGFLIPCARAHSPWVKIRYPWLVTKKEYGANCVSIVITFMLVIPCIFWGCFAKNFSIFICPSPRYATC